MNDESRKEQVDALCPECGQGFKAYIDRLMPEEHDPHGRQALHKIECPHCGCKECKMDESVR